LQITESQKLAIFRIVAAESQQKLKEFGCFWLSGGKKEEKINNAKMWENSQISQLSFQFWVL